MIEASAAASRGSVADAATPTDAEPDAGPALTRWEQLLRTARGRLLLGLLGALTIAALVSAQVLDFLTERGRPVDGVAIFAAQLVQWLPWGLLFVVAGPLCVRSWRIVRPGALALALQVGLALAAGWSHGWITSESLSRLSLGPSSDSGEGEFGRAGFDPARRPGGPMGAGAEARPVRSGPPAETRDGAAHFRPSFNRTPGLPRPGGHALRGALTYGAVLGLGLLLHGWLATRDQERRTAALQLRTSRLQGELTRARLDRLTAQLRPHFLFNTLHAVGSLVREGRDDDALSVLDSVGGLLRSSLDPSGRQEVTVSEELETVRRYLAIEAVRMGERLAVEIRAGDGCLEALVPQLLLLPLVENAITHAAAPRVEPTRIAVTVSRHERELQLTVEDDGAGFPAAVLLDAGLSPDDRPHIGLANTRSRLAALHGEGARLALERGALGGARAVVTLPFRCTGETQA